MHGLRSACGRRRPAGRDRGCPAAAAPAVGSAPPTGPGSAARLLDGELERGIPRAEVGAHTVGAVEHERVEVLCAAAHRRHRRPRHRPLIPARAGPRVLMGSRLAWYGQRAGSRPTRQRRACAGSSVGRPRVDDVGRVPRRCSKTAPPTGGRHLDVRLRRPGCRPRVRSRPTLLRTPTTCATSTRPQFITAPRGWEVVRLVAEYPNRSRAPMTSSLLADAVREAGRPRRSQPPAASTAAPAAASVAAVAGSASEGYDRGPTVVTGEVRRGHPVDAAQRHRQPEHLTSRHECARGCQGSHVRTHGGFGCRRVGSSAVTATSLAHVVKAYDVRGTVLTRLDTRVTRALGAAFADVVVIPEGAGGVRRSATTCATRKPRACRPRSPTGRAAAGSTSPSSASRAPTASTTRAALDLPGYDVHRQPQPGRVQRHRLCAGPGPDPSARTAGSSTSARAAERILDGEVPSTPTTRATSTSVLSSPTTRRPCAGSSTCPASGRCGSSSTPETAWAGSYRASGPRGGGRAARAAADDRPAVLLLDGTFPNHEANPLRPEEPCRPAGRRRARR